MKLNAQSTFLSIVMVCFYSLFADKNTESKERNVKNEDSSIFSLFDLTIDPYETTDLSTNTTYVDNYLDYFQERMNYWMNLSVHTNQPDNSNQSAGWAACGRICAWIADTPDDKPIEINQIYNYSNAPNLVFVLVDDWGFNDFGMRSTYLNWTTPTLDYLAKEGVLLTNYYTNELCMPSRASLLTGRYNLRLGVYDPGTELQGSEITLGHELKSAGYDTYLIGKWNVGVSKQSLWPLQRGFDYFYGYMSGWKTYWGKKYNGYVDLFENNNFVTTVEELDSTLHSGYLFQTKAEEVIRSHYEKYESETIYKPFFLYYAMQLIHYPWTAPEIYIQRCVKTYEDEYLNDDKTSENDDQIVYNYCAMVVMMDEAIANLTCTLEKYGYDENTILIISGDNGGIQDIPGNSLPFRGHKNTTMRGGISNTVIIHGKHVPEASRGTSYDGLVHITDWLPTLMGLATNGSWNGSYSNAIIDGLDVWHNAMHNKPTGREEMVVMSRPNGAFTMQYNNIKYITGFPTASIDFPEVIFPQDLYPELSRMTCENPSLVDN